MSDSAPRRIVLAYSGGLDTSVILKWLRERYGAEVVAYCADVGQAEELAGLEAKALATGAARYLQDDLREAFVERYVFPALRAAAIYEGGVPARDGARAAVHRRRDDARRAREVSADAIAHGATSARATTRSRFELGAYHFDPSVKVIAPWRGMGSPLAQ